MKVNKGHYHELMDRIHVQIETIDSHLINHPLTTKDKKIKKKLTKALKLLFDAYQYIGAKTHE